MKYQNRKKALILLADGTIFHGKAVGDKEGSAFGEGMDWIIHGDDSVLAHSVEYFFP